MRKLSPILCDALPARHPPFLRRERGVFRGPLSHLLLFEGECERLAHALSFRLFADERRHDHVLALGQRDRRSFRLCGQSPRKGTAVRWMAIAISCWLVFMFLEIVEWVRLAFIIQMGPRTQFGQIFFVLTGFHFLCIFGCVMWLAVVTADTQHKDLLAASIYSHFLNVIWLAMIVVLYFNNADLEGL